MPVPPLMLATPVLAGTGKIGSEVTVQPGAWSGDPAPDLALQWRCGGADIPGATEASYVPGPGDDGKDLACAVSAGNAAGSVLAVTASLRVSQVAPVAKGKLPEEIFDQGSGVQTVETAADFTGEALRFAVTGAGATIDALTGRVGIPTDAPISGEMVVVTATNSGGQASSAFQVTIEATEIYGPPAPTAADWELRAIRFPNPDSTGFTGILDLQNALGAVEVQWTGVDVANWPTDELLEPHWRPTVGLDAGETSGTTAWRFSDFSGTDYIRAPGNVMSRIRFRYRVTPAGLWSPYAAEAKVLSEALIATTATPAKTGYYFMPFRTAEEAAQGLKGGCQEQFWHGMDRSRSDPSLILAGQDTGGTWISDDDGKTWKKNRDRFLYGFGMQGVAIDPTDPSRFYVAGQMLFQSANNTATLDGIYVSTDKGDSWTLKQVCPNMQHQRVGVNTAFDPTTSGSGLNIYVTIHYEDGHGEVWRSTNRGEGWVKRLTIPLTATGSAVSGHVTGVQAHPSVSGTVFLSTQKGLWKSTDGAASWVRMTGSGGLPVEEVLRVEINPANGNEIYTVINTDARTPSLGLWHTVNGGTSWTQITLPSAGATASAIYVGSADGGGWEPVASRTLYVMCRGSQMQVSLNGGASWTTISATGRPGHSTNWDTLISNTANGRPRPALCGRILPHPTKRRSAVAHSNGHVFRTDNALNWRYSGEGFSGLITFKYRSGIAFGTNPLNFICGHTDAGISVTKDGGRTFWQTGVKGTRPRVSRY